MPLAMRMHKVILFSIAASCQTGWSSAALRHNDQAPAMKVSWVLFIALTAVLWYLWPQLPLLPGIAHSLGSLMVMMCASYFLAKYLWAIAGVRLVSGYGKAVLITGE